MGSENLLLTGYAVVQFLTQVEELKGYEITYREDVDGGFIISIGDNDYKVSGDSAPEVELSAEDIGVVEGVMDDAFDQLVEDSDVEIDNSVESGTFMNLVKSLLLGGMVRAIPKLMK